jgi:hypothetical protein
MLGGGMALHAGGGFAADFRGSPAGTPDPQWHSLHLGATRYLTMPAQLNGFAVTGMIDTGATRSVVKDALALELGLPYLGRTLAGTFTQDVSGSLYRVDELVVDDVRFAHVDVAGFNVSELEVIAGSLPLIIGQDILRHIALEVDFTQDRASVIQRSHRTKPLSHVQLELMGSGRDFPSLAVSLEGRVHEHAIVDLGSNLPMSIDRDFAAQTGLLKDRRLSTTMSVGVEGTAVSQILTLANARLGPFILRAIPLCVVEDWRLERPINLGWPIFRAFDAIFDLGGDSLSLGANAALLAQPFPKDRSGIGGQRRTSDIVVRHVALNSPAWQAGLREGDLILAIDGRPVGPSYPARGERMGLKPAGTRIHLLLSNEREVTITLADYF